MDGRRTRHLILLLALVVTAGLAGDAAAQRPEHAGPAPDKGNQARLDAGDSRTSVTVRFAEGTDIRLRGGRLVSESGGRIPQLDDVLDDHPGLRIRRVFSSLSEEELEVARREARQRAGAAHADMNLFFALDGPPGTDIAGLVAQLNRLDIVALAAPSATPVPPPATPSFVAQQGYRLAASSSGIDAVYANGLAGGKGERAVIVDVEYSWNTAHEDLAKARLAGAKLANGTACDPFNSTDHGTAVLGEMVGDANSFGVTGLSPSAGLRMANASSRNGQGTCVYNLANAITLAANSTASGDVILIEQQLSGPRWSQGSDVGLVPSEWDQTTAVWTAIRNATDLGRIVVEAAGNGYQNLDDAVYNDGTGRNWFSYDSGAIMVGAGNAPNCGSPVARGRLDFSNYGSRLNVQGWGRCVTTTGYGNLQGGVNTSYTAGFSGTSSASPIVASAAAIVSSVREQSGPAITPAGVRSLLASTGQPQVFGPAGKIGPLPNLRQALPSTAAAAPALADGGHSISGATVEKTTVPIRQAWTTKSGTPTTYDVWLSTDGGTFVRQSLRTPTAAAAVFQLERNHTYQFRGRAKNGDGAWGAFTVGRSFVLSELQENSTSAKYTGTWTRAAYEPAVDGFLSVSDIPGATVSYTFTGDNVAWVGTRATNRGQARVFMDGTLVKTIDVFSDTITPRAILYSRRFSAVGTHTLKIEVVGKIDVDAFVRLR